MPNFVLIDIPEVSGIIEFKKLKINDHCPFEEFCEQIRFNGNLKSQLEIIFDRMRRVAMLQRFPKEKLRDITPAKETVKEFEIKTRDLRVYLIKERGHIIVLGGLKKNQKSDIRKFRSIKKLYL